MKRRNRIKALVVQAFKDVVLKYISKHWRLLQDHVDYRVTWRSVGRVYVDLSLNIGFDNGNIFGGVLTFLLPAHLLEELGDIRTENVDHLLLLRQPLRNTVPAEKLIGRLTLPAAQQFGGGRGNLQTVAAEKHALRTYSFELGNLELAR